MKKILFILPIIVFLAAGCNTPQPSSKNLSPTPAVQNTKPLQGDLSGKQNLVSTSTPNYTPPPPTPVKNIFEDDRIKVSIPQNWTGEIATETVGGQKPYWELPMGLTLKQDNFRLSLLTHYGQTSGVIGGRFDEVSGYFAPQIYFDNASALENMPTGCGGVLKEVDTKLNNKLTRVDLYLDTASADNFTFEQCGKPKIQGSVYYGSFFTETCQSQHSPNGCGGYFLTYQDITGKTPQDRVVDTVSGKTTIPGYDDFQMAYLFGYNNKISKSVVLKGDAQLNTLLEEVTNIVESIIYK